MSPEDSHVLTDMWFFHNLIEMLHILLKFQSLLIVRSRNVLKQPQQLIFYKYLRGMYIDPTAAYSILHLVKNLFNLSVVK